MSEEGNTEGDEMTERMKELYEEKGIKLHPTWVNIDRPGGLLTKTDRKYLIGEKEYEHQQSDAKRRQEIRKRVENGFLDVSLMLYFLENKEKKKIFENFDERTRKKVLSDLIAFLFMGVDQDLEQLEEIIERGVSTGSNFDESGAWKGDVIGVDVDLDIRDIPDTDQLYEELEAEKFGKGRRLTPREIGLLVRDGKITEDDLDRIRHVPNKPGRPVSSPRAHSEARDDFIIELKQRFDENEGMSFEEFIENNEFEGNPFL